MWETYKQNLHNVEKLKTYFLALSSHFFDVIISNNKQNDIIFENNIPQKMWETNGCFIIFFMLYYIGIINRRTYGKISKIMAGY